MTSPSTADLTLAQRLTIAGEIDLIATASTIDRAVAALLAIRATAKLLHDPSRTRQNREGLINRIEHDCAKAVSLLEGK